MKVKSLPLAGAAAMAAACALFAMASPARAAADSVVVFNEIHYHPADEINETEWIELRNLQGVDVDISGWRMRGGADFDFPEGTVVPGRGYLVIAKVPTQIAGALGPFDGNLSNSGEELRLENRNRRVMDRLDYGDDGDW
ncbi:MAG: lamin tail domain-containing protein [Verrucomicrobiales bacterium]